MLKTSSLKINRKLLVVFLLAVFFITAISLRVNAQNRVSNLQCEHLEAPMGVDNNHPRLTWQMDDSTQGAKQTAYQLLVSTDSILLAKGQAQIWNSGKINAETSLVDYNGKALIPFTKYYWLVKIWNKTGLKMEDSRISSFETGMMKVTNWTGNWISDGGSIDTRPAPYFRNEFSTTKKIKSARAYIAVGGLYELYINGNKVGNHRLDPMFTRFDRRILYVTYDLTHQLQQGKNAIGVLLGNGWYNMQSLAVWDFDKAPWRNRPTFCLDLRITYEDGTSEVVSTNDSWKTHSSPVVMNSIYTGEHYDSRLDMPGWNKIGYDDKDWSGTRLRASPAQNIVSQLMYPIRNVDEIPAKSVKKFSDSTYVFDLGRNIAGVTKVKLRGDSGTVVRIKHGERLYPNGHVDLSNIDVYYRPKDDSDPFQTDIVILNGKGEVEFMPKFNYKGFQYVEITSSKPINLDKSDVTGYFMHSDVPVAGTLNSSNPLINKLWSATNNSYLSNLMGYPTDCPQREKNGWTGDGHFAVETGLYNFDGITVYEKWLADHRDEQQPNGVLPDIIPTGGWGYGHANGTDWTSTIAIIPWNLYLFYGDSKPLSDNYNNIKSYVNYVDRISPTGLTVFGRGDWVPVKSTSSLEYTSSIYFYVDAEILAKTAKLLNHKEDYEHYIALAAKIKKAINDKYFNPTTAIYGKGVQTELSMALQWGIVPDQYKKRVAQNLADRVAADNMHLDVGVLGTKAILNALSDNGQAETAYKLAAQDTYPSWGWWIKNGATTLYENWKIDAERDISLNHMMFGEIGAWFFKGLGGIHPDESHPGFKNILLRPNFVKELDFFEATHNSPFGKIVSAWKRTGKGITYNIVVPANSSATLTFPAQTTEVFLNGKKLKSIFNYQVAAGSYSFNVIQKQ